MKNLLIYLSPQKNFASDPWGEMKYLSKIQIENSLALGWKPKDIIVVTNFPFVHNGIKSMIVPDKLYCKMKPTLTKILTIIYLLEQGVIGDDLWWFHDFDTFQLENITEEELDLGDYPFALTDYGKTTINEFRDRRWSTGAIFFNKFSEQVFTMMRDKSYQYRVNEEVALLALTRRNRGNINSLIKKLNITYNLATRKRDVSACYEMADKPLRAIHFHPSDKREVELGNDNIGVCVYGKNRLNKILVNERLINLFSKYKVI